MIRRNLGKQYYISNQVAKMKKLILISILFIAGCDYAPTEHMHEVDTDVYGCTNQYAENYLYGSNQNCK